MSGIRWYVLMVVVALISASPATFAAEAWIQMPRVENRQTFLTPTAWGVISRYTGGLYTDADSTVRTVEISLANSAVFRIGSGASAGLWDVTWMITNQGTGDLTRFMTMAGGLPHFLHDVLSPGEAETETATVLGPIGLAQWTGQWGNALTAGGAIYFLAAPVPEPGTIVLLGFALLSLGLIGGVPAQVARSRGLSRP